DFFKIYYQTGDEGPYGPGAVTRAEALPIIKEAIKSQPYYSGDEIQLEPTAEILVETNIPNLFGKAQMQIFHAYGVGGNGEHGSINSGFLFSNGKVLRYHGNMANALVDDIDDDGIYELIIMWQPDPNDRYRYIVRAYKNSPSPDSDTPSPHIAYETHLHYKEEGRYLQLDKTPYGSIRVKQVDNMVYTSATIMADIGLLLFKDGELFPEKMDEYGITFGGEEYFYDPFNPPADWLVSASPPPAP
ncbi:MAG: hypothetical protein LBR85_06010, partial [Oscillospiraceae bacterium]|nr:hypothetical protein [Oscillospiraceae bacterium]